jgi:hypothetical protein
MTQGVWLTATASLAAYVQHQRAQAREVALVTNVEEFFEAI